MNTRNNILLYLFLALPALLMQSCLKDDHEVFDENSSARMQEAMTLAHLALVSSENGWIMDYYPDRNLSYGGYAYTVKFDGEKAEVRYEGDTDQVVTSYYKITNDNGPVLSFDTYNELLHFYATPSSSEYEGKDGDFEFVIDEVDTDIIKLHGKRNQNLVVLRKLEEPAETAIKKVAKLSNGAFLKGYTGTEFSGDFDLNARSMSFTNADGTQLADKSPFIFTEDGIRLYKPVTVGGKTMQNFKYDEASQKLTCTDEGATDIVLNGIPHDDTYQLFDNFAGDYYFVDYFVTMGGNPIAVTLEPDKMHRIYRMKGVNADYELRMRYDKNLGTLTLYPQGLGYDETLDIGVYLLGLYGDDFYISLEGGMRLLWNGDNVNPVYQWIDNGDVEGEEIHSFTVMGLDLESDRVEQELDAKWNFGDATHGTFVPYLDRLIKR